VKVLFDHNVPKRLRRLLQDHNISTSREMGWDSLKNGDLLVAAEASGFEVMVTGDKNLAYQQNLEGRKLGLVILGATDWNILKRDPSPVIAALDRAGPGSFERLEKVLPGPRRSFSPGL